MRFSIIIPSYLGPYQGAAKNRDEKLFRAIDSCLVQTFTDYEVIVVADGCEKTFNLVLDKYAENDNVECILIRKMPLWSGKPRNIGIKNAKGDYIVYLDADDKLGTDHLNIIDTELTKAKNPTWVWFNDFVMQKETPQERQILINNKYQNGTSNICHRRDAAVEWSGSAGGYGTDDWSVIVQLKRYSNFVKIKTPQYHVCHLPNRLDV